MVFSSLIFLFLFLPAVLFTYFISPVRLKNFILLAASLLFYTWGEGKMVLILLLSSLIDFCCGIIIEKGRKRLGLFLSIVSNLSILFLFKYLNFSLENFKEILNYFGYSSDLLLRVPLIALPIGISFYTFQTMSYTIDVYRGHVKANYNFIDFAAFVCLFPQLVAGPIVRYADVDRQIKSRTINVDKFSSGISRFVVGLFKKVFIANTFASIADGIFSENIEGLSTLFAWVAIISYSIQIYFDFSGYSDMAIGLGKMFGFDFLENFNHPYTARNIRDFWQRWHISLSTWFRDYLYIPLGGNRLSNSRTYFNLFIVFFITGLWHGASWNFICWGLFHGVFIILERIGLDKILGKIWRVFQHVYTLLVVIIAWVFFRSEDLSSSISFINRMFYFSSGDISINSYFQFYYFNDYNLFAFIVALLFSMPLYKNIIQLDFFQKRPWVLTPVYLGLFIFCVMLLDSSSYNPFIYFRF